jgi:hypothetical protein
LKSLRDAHVGLPEEKIKGCLALKKLQIEPVPMGFLIDFSQISHRSLTDFTVSVYRKPQSESQNTLW